MQRCSNVFSVITNVVTIKNKILTTISQNLTKTLNCSYYVELDLSSNLLVEFYNSLKTINENFSVVLFYQECIQ